MVSALGTRNFTHSCVCAHVSCTLHSLRSPFVHRIVFVGRFYYSNYYLMRFCEHFDMLLWSIFVYVELSIVSLPIQRNRITAATTTTVLNSE